MDEAYLEKITRAVQARLSLPRALCIGEVPENPEFLPVEKEPYDMVVLCSLSPAQLLAMPSDAVCRALLRGIPVYLMEEGLEHRSYGAAHCGTLYRELMAKERYLRQLGVKVRQSGKSRVYTAEDVRLLGKNAIPVNAMLTPLARDLLEGKG